MLNRTTHCASRDRRVAFAPSRSHLRAIAELSALHAPKTLLAAIRNYSTSPSFFLVTPLAPAPPTALCFRLLKLSLSFSPSPRPLSFSLFPTLPPLSLLSLLLPTPTPTPAVPGKLEVEAPSESFSPSAPETRSQRSTKPARRTHARRRVYLPRPPLGPIFSKWLSPYCQPSSSTERRERGRRTRGRAGRRAGHGCQHVARQ